MNVDPIAGKGNAVFLKIQLVNHLCWKYNVQFSSSLSHFMVIFSKFSLLYLGLEMLQLFVVTVLANSFKVYEQYLLLVLYITWKYFLILD
jgi:hypothetical protein